MRHRWKALPAGDRVLILEFGQTIEREIVDKVVALNILIHEAMRSGKLDGLLETIPTFRSLALVFDPLLTRHSELSERIRTLQTEPSATSTTVSRHWRIPVHYGGQSGPDLDSVVNLTGLSPDKVISLHQEVQFKVYMLGFLPGFAFMGDTPKALHLPRRTEPRLRVPAGSVAIANQLTGVYPWESPGGWHILGNSPISLFDGRLDPPALFRTGDTVSFHSIDADQWQSIASDVEHGRFDRSALLQSGPDS